MEADGRDHAQRLHPFHLLEQTAHGTRDQHLHSLQYALSHVARIQFCRQGPRHSVQGGELLRPPDRCRVKPGVPHGGGGVIGQPQERSFVPCGKGAGRPVVDEKDPFNPSLHPDWDGKFRHHILGERVCEVILRDAGILCIVSGPKRLPRDHDSSRRYPSPRSIRWVSSRVE